MHFYKQIKDGKTTAYMSALNPIVDESLNEIPESEYLSATAEKEEIPITETEESNEYDILLKRISELEEENAALLFENLTGEEFNIV